MRSLRLDPDLDARVRHAAAVNGESVSEFLRRAALQRLDATLAPGSRERFADVIGVVHGQGGRARRSGTEFTKTLRRDRGER
ncbi:MAG: ribbon-helix-helix protein, CopG family [Candidatus Dormibacteria bacterium]